MRDRVDLPSNQNRTNTKKFRSKEDDVEKISLSIFITNFPDDCLAKDLFNSCKLYRHVVDSFIPNKRSINAFVLDEDYLLDYDYSLALMGKVSDFGLLNNLKTTLIKEGFDKLILKYLGGFWVLIELHSKEILEKFKSHVGVGSWFTSLEYASYSFYIDERVVWLDMEGIPMEAWTLNTFNKLVKNIFENCKIIIKRKVFWIRVKEVSGWVPGFMEDDDEEDSSEDDALDNEFARDKSTDEIQVEAEIEDEVEKVSDTIFENDNELVKDGTDNDNEEGVFQSEDPFNIYPILNKTKHKRIDKEVLNTKESLEFPPGGVVKPLSWEILTKLDLKKNILIKVWVRTKKESDKVNKTNLKGLLKDVNRMIDEKQADQELINKRIQTMNSLQDLEMLEVYEVAQKVKIKWSIKGDENSRFFHAMLNKKRNQQAIRGILKDVNVEQLIDLERDVSKEEIKRAVWDCGSDKSPGPDGFTFGFYRRFWDIIEFDVVEAVYHFFTFGSFPKGGNASFIALIPKLHDARVVKDFRPFCLIGSVYKIVAKILANRLVEILGDLVHEVQSAFIANRQILDGPFILDELIHWCKSKKMQSMLFKVDFEKAYDSVRWDYLDDILNKFGFGLKWRMWISNCLTSSKGSILVNGIPTKEFYFHKCLKQGDPLSPFLFLLIMETLHMPFQNLVNAHMFTGISVDSDLQISHLFYADDVIFTGQWSDGNINTIIQALDCFHKASGLRLNLQKSKIMGISVNDETVCKAASKMGCHTLKTLFSYLGVKVGGSMPRIRSWDEIMDKVKSRLSKWKMKSLSIGGIDLMKFLNKKVGNESNTSFWEEIWRGDKSFKVTFPRVFVLESDKKIDVATKMKQNDLGFSLRRSPRDESDKKIDVATKMKQNDLGFSLRRSPRDGVELEQFNALKLLLAVVRNLYRKISIWWDNPYVEFDSYDNWLEWLSSLRSNSKRKAILEGIFYITWWMVWNHRNKAIFDANHASLAIFLMF
nr:RNA-directed DNA polymerase, eukaryota [Tanacetum cinerariifolium]